MAATANTIEVKVTIIQIGALVNTFQMARFSVKLGLSVGMPTFNFC